MQSKMYLTRVSKWEREILLILRGEDIPPHVPDTHAHTCTHTHTHTHTHSKTKQQQHFNSRYDSSAINIQVQNVSLHFLILFLMIVGFFFINLYLVLNTVIWFIANSMQVF